MSPGRHAGMQTNKIAGSDFEQPKAGPKGGGQDAQSKPDTLTYGITEVILQIAGWQGL